MPLVGLFEGVGVGVGGSNTGGEECVGPGRPVKVKVGN